jgi:hypothetical protein
MMPIGQPCIVSQSRVTFRCFDFVLSVLVFVVSTRGLCVALNDAHWSAMYREPMT